MKKKAVITGASGYIGSHLTQALLAEGWEVYAILRPTSKMTLLENTAGGLSVFRFDGQMDRLQRFFRQIQPVETVFHLASCFIAEHTWQQVEDLIDSNIKLGTMLLEAMRESDCKQFINTATAWQHYQDQDYNPVCLYAATKEAFEKIIDYYAQAHGFGAITLELLDTYGPNDPRAKVLNLLYKSWQTTTPLEMSGGEQELDLVYIDDVIQAYLQAAKICPLVKGQQKFAVASQKPYTLREIVAMIEGITGDKLPVTFGKRAYRQREVMTSWKGGARLPNWQPVVELEAGIKKIFQKKDTFTNSCTNDG